MKERKIKEKMTQSGHTPASLYFCWSSSFLVIFNVGRLNFWSSSLLVVLIFGLLKGTYYTIIRNVFGMTINSNFAS